MTSVVCSSTGLLLPSHLTSMHIYLSHSSIPVTSPLCISTSVTPVSLSPIHIYLSHSSIPVSYTYLPQSLQYPCLLYISTSVTPVSLSPIHIYLHHSSIPVTYTYLPQSLQYLCTCKYGIGTDFKTYFLYIVCLLAYFVYLIFLILISRVFFSITTLLMIIALLGFEFARKPFHCM
jgi:hypothetical protein